jgi:hypothetical protein
MAGVRAFARLEAVQRVAVGHCVGGPSGSKVASADAIKRRR